MEKFKITGGVLLDKNWVPLCKRESDFIYVESKTNQFYSVTESKISKNVDWIIYIASIFGATFFRYLLATFEIELPILYRLGGLLLLLFVPFLIARSQLRKWEKFIDFTPIILSEQTREYVLNESEKNQKGNTILLVFLVALFLVSSVVFIANFDIISLILTIVFGYVLALLVPTLKLKVRKDFIIQFKKEK